MKNLNVIQWNCEGARAKSGELENLALTQDPYCICAQETKLRPGAKFSIPKYKSFLNNYELEPGDKIAKGGVGIFVKRHIAAYQVQLKTPLQAVAVSIKIGKKRITYCSLYLPPADIIKKEDLTGLLDQLPKPYMVLGDFNARSTLWHMEETNTLASRRGAMIAEIIAENDIFLLDGNKNTHMSRRMGTEDSHIDLSLCSTELLTLFEWDVLDDTRGSDHHPIKLTSVQGEPRKDLPRWDTNRADWPQYKMHTDNMCVESDQAYEAWNLLKTTVSEAAIKTIPRTKGGGKRRTPLWWNRECNGAVWKRRAAYRRLKSRSTRQNLLKFNQAVAAANKIIKASKRTSWQKLKDSIDFKSNLRKIWKKINILKGTHRPDLVTMLNVNKHVVKITNFPGESNVDNLMKEMSDIGCVQTVTTAAAEDGSVDITIRFESTSCAEEAQTRLDGRQYMGNLLQAVMAEEEVAPGRQKQGVLIEDAKEIADCLGRRFAHISSEASKSPEFREYKASEEKEFNFETEEEIGYNSPVSERELDDTLKEVSDTTPGPDEITYSMLKNLGASGKKLLLDLLNKVFDEGKLPEDWKLAYVVPILKEGKDPEETNSYRPIALTSCVCKLLERILNKRLVWFLEKNGLLYKGQSGFRRGRSTIDSLVTLETEVHNAMVKNKYLVSVFFDLEKAYDTCWKYIIMKELHRFGLKGKLPIFISDFLKDRKFRVKVGNTLSDVYKQEMGVPQGSVLSCNLFSIGVNTLSKVIADRAPVEMEARVNCSIYVDDARISIETYQPVHGARTLQKYINDFEKWGHETGFTFSTTKTEVVVFHKTLVGAVDLRMNGVAIKNVPSKKFLGVIFDRHLNFQEHIAYLRDSALKAMNVLKVIARYNRGSNSADLLRIYRSLVRSKLDYASQVYGTATCSNLKKLDPVHHQAIRLCLGAYRSSPVESLYAESGELPLEFRRQMLQLQYYARTKQFKPSDIQTRLDDDMYDSLYKSKPGKQPSLGQIVRKLLEELAIKIPTVGLLKESNYGPWQFTKPDVCLQLTEMCKANTSPEQYKQQFCAHRHSSDLEIFTDGSKTSEGVGAGIVIMEGSIPQKIGRRLEHMASVFTAEIVAIKCALVMMLPYQNKHTVIYSDSKSCLEAIQGNSRRGLVVEIRELLQDLLARNIRVTLCWIPSHVGIVGNELVDKVAKDATQKMNISTQTIPVSDVTAHVKLKIYHKWKEKWASLTNNQKLKEIRPSLDIRSPLLGWARRNATRLVRLRIGHTRVTHGYHFNGEDEPVCIECEVVMTVKHVLIDCGNFALERLDHYDPRDVTIRQLLTDRALIIKALRFLHQIHWYENI